MRVDAPDRRHALVDRVVHEALERDRRGLGHAVADGDFRHVHLFDHPLHYLDGAACARHDACPERGQVVVAPSGLLQHGDEHGRHAVERGAAGLGHRMQRLGRIESLAWKHHRRTLSDAAQHAHHHAETVVERHRYAQRLPLGQPDAAGDEARIVDDVPVGERGALGGSGGAGGELDVDRVVGVEARGERVQPPHLLRPAEPDHILEAEYPGAGVVAHRDDGFEMWQLRRPEPARLAMLKFGREFAQHVDIARRLEGFRRDDCPASDRIQRVFELERPVGGIDVDQDRAEAGGGELRQDPFEPVGRPDADAVALAEPERQEPGGKCVHLPVELLIGQRPALLRQHDRPPRAVAGNRLCERLRNGLVSERRRPFAGDMGQAVPRRAGLREAGSRALGEGGHRAPPLHGRRPCRRFAGERGQYGVPPFSSPARP